MPILSPEITARKAAGSEKVTARPPDVLFSSCRAAKKAFHSSTVQSLLAMLASRPFTCTVGVTCTPRARCSFVAHLSLWVTALPALPKPASWSLRLSQRLPWDF